MWSAPCSVNRELPFNCHFSKFIYSSPPIQQLTYMYINLLLFSSAEKEPFFLSKTSSATSFHSGSHNIPFDTLIWSPFLSLHESCYISRYRPKPHCKTNKHAYISSLKLYPFWYYSNVHLSFMVKVIEIIMNTEFLCCFSSHSFLTTPPSGSCLHFSPRKGHQGYPTWYTYFSYVTWGLFSIWCLLTTSTIIELSSYLPPIAADASFHHLFMFLCLLMKMLRLSKLPFLALLPFYTDWELFFVCLFVLYPFSDFSPDHSCFHIHILTLGCTQVPHTYYMQTWSNHLSPCFFSYILQFEGWYSYLDRIPNQRSC